MPPFWGTKISFVETFKNIVIIKHGYNLYCRVSFNFDSK